MESLRLRDARARGSFAACLAAVVACSLGGAALGDGLLCKGRDVLGSLALPGSARGVAVAGGTAYIANDFFGLRIIDVSNPASPVLLGTLDTPGQALRVTVVGTTAYVADYTAGLQIIDVSNPASPALIGSFDTAGEAEEVRVADGLAYIADGTAGLQIVDVSDPAAPKPVGSYPGIFCRGVRVVGDVTYVGTWTGDLGVIDTSDPAAPTLITNVATPGGFVDGLDADGQIVCLANKNGVSIVDFSDFQAPKVSHVKVPGRPWDVRLVGGVAFVAEDEVGIEAIDVSNPARPLPLGVYGAQGRALGIATDGAAAFIAGDEAGLAIIDVSGPAALLSRWSAGKPAAAVSVVGTTAYLADVSRLHVVDVGNPTAPVELGSVFAPSYGMTVVGNYAYLAPGPTIVDISNPRNPTVVFNGGYDGPFISVSDGIAYFGYGPLDVLDVSNPASPVLLASYLTKVWALGGVFATDGVVYLVGLQDTWSGFETVDVSDPAAPKPLGFYKMQDDFVVSVNVVGNTAVVTGSRGLSIFDVSNPAAPVLLGVHETPGRADSLCFQGNTAYITTFPGYPPQLPGAPRLQAIDVSVPSSPVLLGDYGLAEDSATASGVSVSDGLACIADYETGFLLVDAGECPLCPPDLDKSGALDLFDFLVFVNLFNAGDMQADFDGSGTLDLFDFLAFVNAFNGGC